MIYGIVGFNWYTVYVKHASPWGNQITILCCSGHHKVMQQSLALINSSRWEARIPTATHCLHMHYKILTGRQCHRCQTVPLCYRSSIMASKICSTCIYHHTQWNDIQQTNRGSMTHSGDLCASDNMHSARATLRNTDYSETKSNDLPNPCEKNTMRTEWWT